MGIFATIRQFAIDDGSVQSWLATLAAWTTALVFLVSSSYHVASPDRTMAMAFRAADYVAIYVGVTINAVADLAAVSRGFVSVPTVTVVDLPIACLLLITFFLWRRVRLGSEETWVVMQTSGDDAREGGGKGELEERYSLLQRTHHDLHHSSARSATSLLLTAGYFMAVPVAIVSLGNASVLVLALQGTSFGLLLLGMCVDRVWQVPDKHLRNGRCLRWFSCPRMGCVVLSHGLWHVIAIISAVLTLLARELALQA